MFDPSVIWAAIAAVGMLKTAQVDGVADPVQIGFETPDLLELGTQVTVAEYQMEYRAQDLPDLARGTELAIDGSRYRVRRPPRRKGDGYFEARRQAGRDDLRFHDLRHTGLTNAAIAGATLAELMQLAGHSTAGAAMRYQGVAKDRMQDLAKRLSAIAEGGQ